MILITEIKTLIVGGHDVEIAHYKDKPYVKAFNGDMYEPVQMEQYYEYIRGEKFVNVRGEEVYLGMTAQVQEVLGLPISVYNNHNREIEKLNSIIHQVWEDKRGLILEIKRYKSMKFIDRLKFLFGIVK